MTAAQGKTPLSEALLSVVIKTLNEEGKIGACIESVIAALREVPNPSEIIVADSISADGTVAVATRYPVKVVQFSDIADRGCGAGVQLGYQHARGELILLLDGDMTLLPSFLPAAMKAMEADPTLGGVAGLMEEVAIRNAFDAHRVTSGASSNARIERWLNGGGLYRRTAIDAAGGYAADRNLKGWEEAELGMRLRSAGWRLCRLETAAVRHDGHAAGTWAILRRHWKSRRLMSNGVLVRSALMKPWFFDIASLLAYPLFTLLVWLVAAAVILLASAAEMLPAAAAGIAIFWSMVGAVLAFRKKSLIEALRSIAIWHVNAAALLLGLFVETKKPTTRIASDVVFSHS